MSEHPVRRAAEHVDAVPATRSGGRGAVPADAGARAPRRRSRGRRAHGLRGALLPTLVAPGAVGRHVPRRGPGEPAPHDPHRGSPRHDPRPERQAHRRQRRRHRREGLGGRPAEAGPLRRHQAARLGAEGAAGTAREGGRPADRRPAQPDHGEDRGRRGPGRIPLRAPGRVPRRPDPADLPPALPAPDTRGAGSRVRRRGVGGRPRPEAEAVPLGRQGRQGRGRVDVRRVPPRRVRPGADPGRLARPPAGAARAEARGAARARRAADHRHRAPAGRRARAPVRDRDRPGERVLLRQRRRARRARPARRRGPRDGVDADVQAVRLRRPRRSEEDPAARQRRRGEEAELPRYQPRDHGRLPARVDVEAGGRARGDAGAPARAVRVGRLHAVGDVRPRQAGVRQLGPVRQPRDVAAGGARAVVRHLLLRRRVPLLPRRRQGPDADAGVGAPVRLRRAGGHRRRARGDGPPPDTGVAEADLHERLGQGVEPGRLDPARDRPEGRRGDAAPDGALLRDDRQRRQAREAVRRVAGGDVGGARAGAGRRAPLHARPARVGRRRPRGAAGDPRRPLRRHALDVRHVVRRLLELPDRGRRQDGHGGEGRADPGLPAGAPRGPVVVVRLRAGADRGRADRRLRGDRERRPRLHGGRPGGAPRVRAVLRRQGRDPDPRGDGLVRDRHSVAPILRRRSRSRLACGSHRDVVAPEA